MAREAKHTAAISLGIMGAGFLATFPADGHWAGALLHGGFEAGLVGGLADWFAVTALFRKPLGLPIPHTALLPRNRDKVVRSLIHVIENEFLTKESIKQKAGELRIGEKLLEIAEGRLPDIVRAAVLLGDYGLKHLPAERLAAFAAGELRRIAEKADAAAVLRALRNEILERGYEERALDFLLDKAEDLVSSDTARYQLGSMAASALGNLQVNGLMGFAVNAFVGFMSEDKLGYMLQGAILGKLREMTADEGHPLRVLLLNELRRALIDLDRNEALIRELDGAKSRLLEQWDAEAYLRRWIEELRDRALEWIHSERFERDFALPLLAKLIERVRGNEELLNAFQNWTQTQISQIVERNHSKIGKLVQENLDKLDNDTLIAMMEDKLGKDLQWIRVNGAVCGFLIGLALEGINLML
ncbi:DUF445 domain-containing protein [Cohnella massiliensis]|uniref:DUF445 domain-containing protein n=1 Tax=Cohnella massiliensis TaxID=1816691 RepID=UPI0009BBFD48|nr:DUF445 domain-containing protein [Cohnella massiliensis]